MHYLTSTSYLQSAIVLLLLFISFQHMVAQDLENLGDIPIIKASGSVGFNTMFTETSDTTNQRDPFFYQFQANLNLSLLGIIDAPFSLVLNSQENTVNQPALPTQFGISPNYKAVTGHFGYRSMRFSEYSLGGLMFLGAGVEVQPDDHWLSGSVMYGRFSEALQPVEGLGLGKYQRRGYGIRLNAGDNQNFVSVVGFRAKDDPASINTEELEEDLAPEDNLIVGILFGKQFGRFSIQGEYTSSALTRDTRSEEISLTDFSYYNNLGGLFQANATTIVRSAVDLKGTLALDWANLNLQYKRIAPDYKSLGATSINDDLREISGGLSWQMLEGKLSLGSNIGVQRNNLDEQAAEGVNKIVSSFNAFWMATEKLNFSATYSNFNSNTIRTASVISDTLEFFQVTNNASFMTNYQLGSSLPQSITLNVNYQEAFDSDDNSNNGVNANISYSLAMPESKFSSAVSYNYNITTANGIEVLTAGPSLSLSQPIKDIRLSFTIASLKSVLDGADQYNILNSNFSMSYSFLERHSLALTALYTNRASKLENVASVDETRVNLNYNYRF